MFVANRYFSAWSALFLLAALGSYVLFAYVFNPIPGAAAVCAAVFGWIGGGYLYRDLGFRRRPLRRFNVWLDALSIGFIVLLTFGILLVLPLGVMLFLGWTVEMASMVSFIVSAAIGAWEYHRGMIGLTS